MYSEWERLNPVLAFLWRKQSLAEICSEQRPRETQEPAIKF